MAINFPDSPNNGDAFTSNNKTWVFDGTVWNITSGTNSVADGAITAAKLASNAVHQTKLASNLSAITLTTTANRSTDISSPFTAQFIFLTDTNTLQRWSGSAWTNVLASPPGAPTALSATLLSTTSVSVAFTPGASAGATTTNYKYALSTNGGAAYGEPIAVDPADATSPITISGLTSGTTYHIKLKAVTDVGDSEFSSATSIAVPALTVDYLVVAGGGAGGRGNSHGSGGGGAGGLRSTITATGGGGSLESVLTLTSSTNYAVVVGGGATGQTVNNTSGAQGVNSTFATITSIGGGGGAGWDGTTPTIGGSGGGGRGANQAGASGTANQGYAGGTGGNSATNYPGGGGGGAGGVGSSPASNTARGGAGGVGVQVNIDGNNYYWGGGGGGCGYQSGNGGGDGGIGGGGGGNTDTGTAGIGGGSAINSGLTGGTGASGAGGNGGVNTGGGGGAGSTNSASASGAGGSGIVILRYPSVYTITLGAGLTGSTTTVSSNKVTTITAGSGNVSWA